MSNFIDNDISLFINNKNKDKFFKDFNDNLKDKKRDFNDNFISRNSGNFNDDIKIKRNNNENFNKDNNENQDIGNINSDNCKGIFIDSNYDNNFCKDF